MSAEQDMASGARYEFGENWARFLKVLDDSRIAEAEASLKDMLAVQHLRDQRFLDIGCGSGLFSLAARRLGATVYSFDFDPQSVACARELKRRRVPDDARWRIESGSVLDAAYMKDLGDFDVVYSWGVLHHTGAMWLALEHAIERVAAGGRLFIAIYADQGWKSRAWWFVKLLYNRMPRIFRPLYVMMASVLTRLLMIIKYTIKLRPMTAFAPLSGDRRKRGMSAKRDAVDWIGGFPYEFASLETLSSYLEARGFSIVKVSRARSHGCNELVAERIRCAG